MKEYRFGELSQGAVFTKSKRWYKKIHDKESGKTSQHPGWGAALDHKNRINFFGNNQKVCRYEIQSVC